MKFSISLITFKCTQEIKFFPNCTKFEFAIKILKFLQFLETLNWLQVHLKVIYFWYSKMWVIHRWTCCTCVIFFIYYIQRSAFKFTCSQTSAVLQFCLCEIHWKKRWSWKQLKLENNVNLKALHRRWNLCFFFKLLKLLW